MTSSEIRNKFIEYFKGKGHKVIPSASLVPENDPTVLFTTAGMHPLVPYFSGENHPEGKRLTNAQKCIRTDDIDEVGDKIHHTFFEMLGNWSLGDYFKKEAIEWSFEFLTSKDGLALSLDRLAISVFEGDQDAPFDAESYELWQGLGFKQDRIAKLPKKNNWWGPAGETGPCGPDTEMFVWTGAGDAPDNFQESCEDPAWVEIWNDVFMQYNKIKDNDKYIYEKLSQHNVDTGMGMERALAILNGTDDNYRTDLFWPIILKIEELTGLEYGDKTDEECPECWTQVRRSMRIIADHIKAATFAIGDGAMPSNKGAGYIVRRLIRRAIVKAMQFPENKGIQDNFTTKLAKEVFGIYPNYNLNKEIILAELEKEESKFRRNLKDGLKLISAQKELTAEILFNLFQSNGIPMEISIEEAKNTGKKISDETIQQFNDLLLKHQELSRTASAGKFKGGLADNKEETTRLHTVAHLLLAGLRKVLGDHVTQKGANITEERLRFDFAHSEKVTPEQIAEVEKFVNEQIAKKLPVTMEEMNISDAKASGASGIFDDKYGNKVKVYTIGDGDDIVSREICGGPHVANTSELGVFKITKEESSSSGVRRIKAILK